MRAILITNPKEWDELPFAAQDMYRWWRQHCKTHRIGGEVLIELADRSAAHLRESIKRLASFGIAAKIVDRNLP